MFIHAAHIAIRAHARQVDKAGRPYLEHVLRVAQRIRQNDGGEVAEVVAILHDVIEDHPEYRPLIEASFTPEVVEALDLVSRRDSESYAEFIQRIADSRNLVAIAVKLADLDDNLSRITQAPSLEARYRKAVAVLKLAGEPGI